jgi:hypothetical protein
MATTLYPAASETETKLSPTKETTEYGVPKTSITSKYSWLGAAELPTELSTGVIDMGQAWNDTKD